MKTTRVPHTCPVCGGRGWMEQRFYAGTGVGTASSATVPCRSCTGTGIVWAWEPEALAGGGDMANAQGMSV